MPVVPATQEAEAGESLELGNGGCNEITPLHSSLATEQDSISKTKTKKKCFKSKVNEICHHPLSSKIMDLPFSLGVHLCMRPKF